MSALQAATALAERVDYSAFGFPDDFDPFAGHYHIELPVETPLPDEPEPCPDWLVAQNEVEGARIQTIIDEQKAQAAAYEAEHRRYAAAHPEFKYRPSNDEDDESPFAECDDEAFEHYCMHMVAWQKRQEKLKASAKQPKAPPAPLKDVLDRYVFIRAAGSYYDLMAKKLCSVTTVHLLARETFVDEISETMLKSYMMRMAKKFDRLGYAPNKPAEYVDEDGLRCLNIYKPSSLVPLVGSAKPWLDHVAMLFGDDIEAREHFYDWLAFKVQNPARKVRHGVILQSCQGAGKGLMAAPLFRIFGSNAISPDNTELLKGQMGFLENKLMVIVHELKAENNRFVADKLKPTITEEKIRIEYKYANPYEIENPASVLAFTNWENALYLEDSDRRWFMYGSKITAAEVKRLSGEGYFKRLADWIDGDGSAFVLRYLLDRDVSNFRPDAHPPMTEAKRQTIEASRGETRNALLELWEDGKAPFCQPLVNLKDAAEYLREHRKLPKVSVESLKRFLREHGARPMTTLSGKHEPVRFIKGDGQREYRERLWLLRGSPSDWHGKPKEEVGKGVWQLVLHREPDE